VGCSHRAADISARFPYQFRHTKCLSRLTVQLKTDTRGLNTDTSEVFSHGGPAVAVGGAAFSARRRKLGPSRGLANCTTWGSAWELRETVCMPRMYTNFLHALDCAARRPVPSRTARGASAKRDLVVGLAWCACNLGPQAGCC
jgi:hypothetical protein